MTNTGMFFRMLFSAVFRRRSRAVMAVVASLVGAATLFCLAMICIAVPQQMNEEMRAYGANLIVTPTASGADGKAGIDSAMVAHTTEMVAAKGSEKHASYRYENVRVNAAPYVMAGIDAAEVKNLNHHWVVDGAWPSAGKVLIGRDVADAMGLEIGGRITIGYRAADNAGSSTSSSSSAPSDEGAGAANAATEGETGTGSAAGSSSSAPSDEGAGAANAATEGETGTGSAAGSSSSAPSDEGAGAANAATEGESGTGGAAGSSSSAPSDEGAGAANAATEGETGTGGAAGSSSSAPSDEGAGAANAATEGETSNTNGSQSSSANASSDQPTQDGRVSSDIMDTSGTEFRVAGIVDTGGSEDSIIYATNDDVAKLTGTTRGVDVIEYSAGTEDLNALVASINDMTSMHVKAQPVTKITSSDTRIITMLQTLFWIVSLVVLALTLVGVGTTISSIVSQRRNEIGLRKALGASSSAIGAEFYVESAMYGLIGGLIGTAIGFGLAQWLCVAVFQRSIGFNWWLAAASVVLSALVAVVASIPPVHRATRIDPAVVLREE